MMSTERPVLRPAGNVAPQQGGDDRAGARKATKPPPSPVNKPLISPPVVPPLLPKISPPNSQPSTPRISPTPQARSPVLKPNSSFKLPAPRKPAGVAPANLAPTQKPCSQADTDPPSHPDSSIKSHIKSITPAARRGASLTRSSSEVFHRAGGGHGSSITPKSAGKPPAAAAASKNVNKLGSLSLDETSLAHIVAAKKAAASVASAQRKLKVAEYGRKQGKASRVAPDVSSVPPVPAEPKRCKFITPQSDPLHVAYHDEEWGVPVHDDRLLFELLVLAGAQVELSWSTILYKRDSYRSVFRGFDPLAVASFTEKHIQTLEADQTLLLPGGKIRGVVENAHRILEIMHEHGSLDNYFWSFLNHKPMINSYRYPKQVPVKTSKSESISKDLVRRGFRFVGPTIIYSFMQAAGMTNDHLMQCFRHQECVKLASVSQVAVEDKLQEPQCFRLYEECEFFSLCLDVDQGVQAKQHECFSDQLSETHLEEQEIEETDNGACRSDQEDQESTNSESG